MRALQVYAPDGHQAEYRPSIAAAAAWLAQARARTTEDHVFQLLGLAWAGRDAITLRRYARALLAEQRPDGGWAQLPSIASDAYATGQVLVALAESGRVASRDRAYARGVKFLLNTQLEDGSWFVRTRAVPIQPYFESWFPQPGAPCADQNLSDPTFMRPALSSDPALGPVLRKHAMLACLLDKSCVTLMTFQE